MRITFQNFEKSVFALVLPLFLSASPTAFAADPPKKTPAAAPASTAPAAGFKFRPPATGLTAVRVTGGSRGEGDQAVTLDVLAPNDIGLTTQEQPSLFWYQSKPSDAKFELTLIQDKKAKPLMRMTLDRASRAGIQRVKMSELHAKLEPGVEYQWVVALILDPENRSRDLIASGSIKRIVEGSDLKSNLGKADATGRPAVYAEAGIWYDALAALSDQIEANPTDKSLRQSRAELLRQVGLKAAAAADEGAR